MHSVSTIDDIIKNKFGTQRKNLASIIRGYKYAVTMYSRKNGIDFKWQPGFYEHIIRSEKDHKYITEYILNNPINWKDDELYIDYS